MSQPIELQIQFRLLAVTIHGVAAQTEVCLEYNAWVF